MPSERRLPGHFVVVLWAVIALVVAQAAVGLLSPDLPPTPATVTPSEVLGADRTALADEYRSGQRLRTVLAFAVEIGLLGLLAAGKPSPVRRAWERFARRPFLGGALAGAAISLILALADLPVGILGHGRAVDVGLSTQGFWNWLADWAIGVGITAVLAATGAAILIALQRRFQRRWWLAGSGVVVAYAVVFTWLGPVLVAPLFSRVDRLPEGQARSAVLALAQRADVEVGEVYMIDASRRSTSLNAYVDGIGSTKRVVIYDNLLEAVDRRPLRAVVAHELGHVSEHDIQRGLLYLAIVAPCGLVFVRELGDRLAASSGATPGTPAALPAYALALALAAFSLGAVSNQLSRAVETKADLIALELTGDPTGQVELQRRLASSNLSDSDPPGWWKALFATHPSPAERIARAQEYGWGEP